MIDNDTSRFADSGYGDWVELPGGDVYFVNYIVDTAPIDRPQIRGYRITRDELLSPTRALHLRFSAPEYRRGKVAGQAGWVRQRPELWRTTEWLEDIDYGPLGNYVVIDGEQMTGSRNRGGNEEVVRLDVGPYDLDREEVELSIVHRGRQRVAIVRLADQAAHTIVELRSDEVYDQLWARDNRGVPYPSDITVGDGWWRTGVRVSSGRVELRSAPAGDDPGSAGAPWATLIADDTYPHHSALAALVIALGDAGGFYIDEIAIAHHLAVRSRPT